MGDWTLNSNSSLFGQMGAWGQPQVPQFDPATTLGYDGSFGFDKLAEMDKLDPVQRAQIAAYERMGQPPSKWATGAQTFGNIAQGIGGLASIYMGLKGLKQQKEMFNFQKGVTNTNLNNSIMDYNRRLGDTLTNRSLNNGQGQGWVSDQLAKYSAKRSQ